MNKKKRHIYIYYKKLFRFKQSKLVNETKCVVKFKICHTKISQFCQRVAYISKSKV